MVISVEDLSKSYQLGVIGTGKFRSDMERFWAKLRRKPDPTLKIDEMDHGNRKGEMIWALKDINFTVQQGEVLGIIGRNGAGKSTLLKILSQVTSPTSGMVNVKGKIASLLEVGTGFHPELTGRENIFLNGAILGMTRSEVSRKFDEIVDFSDVEKFIDTPVKRYSSGMYVRLAFAVAAHLDPEILIVDEVLAVGDAQFQKKCLGKMDEEAKGGRTILFVSHNMAAVRQLCRIGMLLDFGRIVNMGGIDNVVEEYLASVVKYEVEKVFSEPRDAVAYFNRICLKNSKGEKAVKFSNFENIIIEIEFTITPNSKEDHLSLEIGRVDGVSIIKGSDDDQDPSNEIKRLPGKYISRFHFPGGLINEGTYWVAVRIGKPRREYHDVKGDFFFEIQNETNYAGSSMGKRAGVLSFPLKWEEECIALDKSITD